MDKKSYEILLENYRLLQDEFGEQTVVEFVNRVHDKIELIISNPHLFRKSLQKNIFFTVVHKRTTLVYRFRPIKEGSSASYILEYQNESAET